MRCMTEGDSQKRELAREIDCSELVTAEANCGVERLPPILGGQRTEVVEKRVEKFYFSIAAIFEAWVKRRQSRHTQRAYRRDVLTFVEFLNLAWPNEATRSWPSLWQT